MITAEQFRNDGKLRPATPEEEYKALKLLVDTTADMVLGWLAKQLANGWRGWDEEGFKPKFRQRAFRCLNNGDYIDMIAYGMFLQNFEEQDDEDESGTVETSEKID